MRRIFLSAAIGVLSLAFVNPVHAQRGGGGGAHAGAAHVGGGAYHGGAGYYHGGYYHGGYNHYHYGYPGVAIGIGIGYPYYGGLGYADPTPIYVPAVGPTLGPSGYSSYYPSDPNAPQNIAPPAPVAPPAVTPPTTISMKPMSVPKDEAYIRVLLPEANAEVLLEGKATDTLGRDRLFSSPKLDLDGKYTYTVTASWLDQGHLVRQIREVPLTIGEVNVVDFRRPPPRKTD
jgi:uncharacterized protein (TIGR03000 family)